MRMVLAWFSLVVVMLGAVTCAHKLDVTATPKPTIEDTKPLGVQVQFTDRVPHDQTNVVVCVYDPTQLMMLCMTAEEAGATLVQEPGSAEEMSIGQPAP